MADARVLIIGAGLSGLTVAGRLIAGESGIAGSDVIIVDDRPRVGGRLATRRLGRAVLDHGAQFFTVRSESFASRVERWLAAGVVEEWSRGFGVVDGYPRYRVRGGMNELANHLAAELTGHGVEIAMATAVRAVRRDGPRWRISYAAAGSDDGPARTDDTAAAVVATPPVPQVLELLDPDDDAVVEPATLSRLEAFDYHRVIALLTVLDEPPGLPSPGALQQPDDPTFTFVADNQAKGLSPVPAVTFHTAHALSAELWTLPDDEVAAALLPPAGGLIGGANVTGHAIERWRYSGPIVPYPEPCLVAATAPGPLVLAGDGFGGSKVEGAFLSGLAAADAVTTG